MTTYNFTAEHFHVDKARWDHSVFSYTIDEAGLAIKLAGHYELGELGMIKNALAEANRLFKHRNWVEIRAVQKGIAHFYRVAVWRDGVAHFNGEVHDLRSKKCWEELHELCQPGHAADFGWLKKE